MVHQNSLKDTSTGRSLDFKFKLKMGNEGGSIPRRDDLVKVHKEIRTAFGDAAATRATSLAALRSRWLECAVSKVPLESPPPYYATQLGLIVDREQAIVKLLNAKKAFKEENDDEFIKELNGYGIERLNDIVLLKPKYVDSKEIHAKRAGHRDDSTAAVSQNIAAELWETCPQTPCCTLTETILGAGSIGTEKIENINESLNNNKDAKEKEKEHIQSSALMFIFLIECGCVMLRSALVDLLRSRRKSNLVDNKNNKLKTCPSCGITVDDIELSTIIINPTTQKDIQSNLDRWNSYKLTHKVKKSKIKKSNDKLKRNIINDEKDRNVTKKIKKS